MPAGDLAASVPTTSEEPKGTPCSSCRKPIYLDFATTEMVCGSCGLVNEEPMMVHHASKLAGGFADDTETRPKQAPQTSYGYEAGKGLGSNLKGKINGRPFGVTNWRATRSLNGVDRSMESIGTHLHDYSRALGLSDIEKQGALRLCRLWKEKQREDPKIGRGVAFSPLVMAACLLSAREQDRTLSVKGSCRLAGVDPGPTFKSLHMLKPLASPKAQLPSIDLVLVGIATRLHVTVEVRELAASLVKPYLGSPGVTSMPQSAVGAAIYAASLEIGHPISQSRIAKAAACTEVSIRNQVKNMSRVLGLTLGSEH